MLANADRIVNQDNINKGGMLMCLFLQRSKYTKNPRRWPVVPFSLVKETGDIAEELKTDYSVGFEKAHVLGWSLGIAEEIERSALVWTKRLVDERTYNESPDKWILSKIETEKYYEKMSPVCHKLKKKYSEFNKVCTVRDEAIVRALFNYLDKALEERLHDVKTEISVEVIHKDAAENGGDITENINVNIRNYEYPNSKQKKSTRVYFDYTCPCTGMTESVFPVTCEEITVALVMIGQIIEDKEKVKAQVESLPYKCEDINDSSFDAISNKDKLITAVLNSICGIETLYQQQVDGERRRIMNEVLDILASEQRKFSLYKDNHNGLYDTAALNKIVMEFFNANLKIIRDHFGAKHVFIYLDENLEPEVNVNGIFCNEWKEGVRQDRRSWFETVAEVGDLFNNFKGTPPATADNLTYDEICPKDPDWSIFLFENAIYKDDNGDNRELPPIVIGLNYEGGAEGKANYLRAVKYGSQSLLWTDFVLPKFAVFACNVMLSLLAHKNADTVMESRVLMEHEVGQIYSGVQGINNIFMRRCDKLREKIDNYKNVKFYNDLDTHFKEFIKKCTLHAGDMDGHFRRVKMKSKIYGENPVPSIKHFDYLQEFLGKWEYIFSSQCRLENKWPHFVYPDAQNRNDRMMYSDPVFLEHAIYNVVNNAIKYSYINTQILVELDRVDNKQIIRVTDYGNYLNPENHDIYKRGVRDAHGEGVRNKEDVNAFSDGADKKEIEGRGLGLYLSKKLVTALKGTITHTCTQITDYNIPLMWPFFDRYDSKEMFKLMWDRLSIQGDILPYDDIKHQYADLSKQNAPDKFENIVNKQNSDLLWKIPIQGLFEQMKEKTYKVTFTMEIPNDIRPARESQ